MSAEFVMSSSSVNAGIGIATRFLDLAGVFSCALLGGAVARTAGLELFGFLVVGIVSGLGGGIMRDVLLQHGTPVALTDYAAAKSSRPVPPGASGAGRRQRLP
ncbi:trimeric intracellular cation channel family protein [Streptomyces sp. NPDC005262]|uniref:trimeric intracellular cation channel family protein n=1 Tax=Streptomyces sp. NPDC005262 TaxID=3364710 RepID=UPI0036C96133